LPGPAEIVEGSVRDARGKPVEGAWVRIGPEFGAALDPSDPYGSRASSGPLARTDAAGEFRLDGVRDGPGRIVASHAAFGYAERAIEVPPGVLARFDLELAPFALVRGRARSDDGAPLAGATVRFEPCAPKLERDATTAADGAFELACPPLAGLELTLVHPVGERTRRFDLAPDARVEWDVVLPAAVVGAEPSGAVCTSLSVGIVDDAGELIRARVLCMSAGVDRRAGPSTHRVHVLRGIPGSYRWELSDVAPGHYSVWASAPGLGLFLAGEVDVAVGARNAFEFPAPRAGALQLSVAAPAARANERWWYVIDPRLYGPDLARGRNAGPAPREIGLAAGVHVVRVESERGARSEREFEIRAGAATVLELELP
ncbi:MAG: carboxypeptidase regulatory-like domain-containing protein, partial [Planctomycetota bacterium]